MTGFFEVWLLQNLVFPWSQDMGNVELALAIGDNIAVVMKMRFWWVLSKRSIPLGRYLCLILQRTWTFAKESIMRYEDVVESVDTQKECTGDVFSQ